MRSGCHRHARMPTGTHTCTHTKESLFSVGRIAVHCANCTGREMGGRLASMDTLLAGLWMVSGSHPGWSKGSGATECWARHVVEESGWGGVLRQMQGMVEKGFWVSLQASESGPLGSVDLEALLLQTLQEKGVVC